MFHRLALVWLVIALSSSLYGQYTIPDENMVNYSCEDKPLREVLSEVGEQTGVTIAFQEEILPGDSIVTISVRNQRLGKFLEYLIKPHNLRYKIIGNQLVLKRNPYVSSGEKITISGYLKDAESGEPLVNANVYLYDKSQGTTTNEYGFYSFTIDKGVQRVYYSYLGYDLGIKEFALSSDTTANVRLNGANQLSEIIIRDSKIVSSNRPEELYPVDVIDIKTINTNIPLGGEADVMRVTQNLAGVTSGADGFGGLSVRGGETNQNLILYDGIPIYNADHAFGLFSIFNSTLVKSATLYKGAFPSHYSGRLSSVLDIRTREGNNQKFQGDVSLGLLALKASVEGPLKKDKSSFLFSFRRTFVDPWIKSLTEYINERDGKDGSSSVFFFDFNGKMNFSLGERSHLYLSYYTGSDNFDSETTELSDDNLRSTLDQTFWDSGNKLASIRWNYQLSNKAFLNLSLYQTQYQFSSFDHDRVDILESNISIDNFYDAGFYQSKIKDNGARLQVEFIPSPKHKIKFGGGAIRHSFEPGLILVDNFDNLTSQSEYVTKNRLNLLLDEPTITGNEYEFFLEDEIKMSKFTYLNLGMNYMIVDVGETFRLPQPRILFTTGSEKYKLKVAFGQTAQYLHSLTNTGLGVPIDLWLPSTSDLPPEKARNASIGHFITGPKIGSLGAEVFYKSLSQITRYGNDGLIDISDESNWETLIPTGDGEAYGLELSWQKAWSRTQINMAYTWSKSTRSFPGINNGETFLYRYDRRHVFHVGLLHKLGESVELSAQWNYGTGNPVTLANGQNYFYVDENGQRTLTLIFDAINNDRLPDYHRLDLGLNIYNTHKWGESRLTFGLYNAYNRKNPFYRDVKIEDVNNPNSLKYEQITILPILPTFSYNLSF